MVTGQKLLLADDSVTIQKVVDLTFSDEGLEVITVGDGRRAIELLDDIVPDIVLADVFMPGVNGYEVCEYIKRSERLSHIPVMLLVGSFEPFDEAEARRVGADDYLTKPFQSIRTLIGKVRSLLSGGSRESAEAPTRQLAPPVEAERENRPDTDFLERSTADTAPLSASDMAEMQVGGSSSRDVSFADLSMDDQMIQTTPAANFGGEGHNAPQGARPTVQYSASDLQDAGVVAPTFESAPEAERQDHAEEYAPAKAAESSDARAEEFAPAPAAEPSPAEYLSQDTRRASRFAGSDDSLLDLGDIEPPPAMAEADDFFLDVLDDSPVQTQGSTPWFSQTAAPAADASVAAAAPTSAAEEMDASARTKYEAETATPGPQAQEFVEAQVMGEEQPAAVAPIEEEATPVAEYQPAPEAEPSSSETFSGRAEASSPERRPGDYHVQGTASETEGIGADTQASAPAAAAVGQITLEQLSPEVIETIARRAVELLSARVVEQVAWEVVPDLAELLIKRRLKEENKQ